MGIEKSFYWTIRAVHVIHWTGISQVSNIEDCSETNLQDTEWFITSYVYCNLYNLSQLALWTLFTVEESQTPKLAISESRWSHVLKYFGDISLGMVGFLMKIF